MRKLALAACAFLFIVTSLAARAQVRVPWSHEPVQDAGLLGGTLAAREPGLQPSVENYQSRYPLKNVDAKLVDNHGDGFEPLYGVRNFRAVLSGIVYRGGANNAYNKHHKRSNSNPLPNEGLDHLCQEGFGTAVYLYDTNYATAPKVAGCQDRFGDKNDLDYKQESPLSSDDQARAILKIISDRLNSPNDQRPIYVHCWNGWHASGFISALTLRQFCGYTGAQAAAYWDRNTDGNNTESGYERIRQRIRAFTPYPEFQIDAALRAKVCPVTN